MNHLVSGKFIMWYLNNQRIVMILIFGSTSSVYDKKYPVEYILNMVVKKVKGEVFNGSQLKKIEILSGKR